MGATKVLTHGSDGDREEGVWVISKAMEVFALRNIQHFVELSCV